MPDCTNNSTNPFICQLSKEYFLRLQVLSLGLTTPHNVTRYPILQLQTQFPPSPRSNASNQTTLGALTPLSNDKQTIHNPNLQQTLHPSLHHKTQQFKTALNPLPPLPRPPKINTFPRRKKHPRSLPLAIHFRPCTTPRTSPSIRYPRPRGTHPRTPQSIRYTCTRDTKQPQQSRWRVPRPASDGIRRRNEEVDHSFAEWS